MQAIYEGDPAREMHACVLDAWKQELGIGAEFRAQQLIDRAGEYNCRAEFRNALLMVAKEQGSSGFINARRLGTWLGRVNRKICGKLCIKRSRVSVGHVYWTLEEVK
jgi:hypothetical protein